MIENLSERWLFETLTVSIYDIRNAGLSTVNIKCEIFVGDDKEKSAVIVQFRGKNLQPPDNVWDVLDHVRCDYPIESALDFVVPLSQVYIDILNKPRVMPLQSGCQLNQLVFRAEIREYAMALLREYHRQIKGSNFQASRNVRIDVTKEMLAVKHEPIVAPGVIRRR